jgi:hypothetical protein
VAVELIAYAAPIAGGVALVAPPSALRTIASAGRVLSVRPQAARLAVITPTTAATPDTPVEAGVMEDAARPFFRLAAARAALPAEVGLPGVVGRWHTALLVCGWLLLLAAGGSAGAVLAGLWLVVGYPALRRAALRRQTRAHTQAADGLAHALTTATLEMREHAGLTELSGVIGSGDGSSAHRYRHAASACEALGLAPLAEFYEALARGAQPAMPWGALALLKEQANGVV